MTLGQLKLALSRTPPDMDNLHVMIMIGHPEMPKGEEMEIGLLAFSGIVPIPGTQDIAIMLGDVGAANVYVKNGNATRLDTGEPITSTEDFSVGRDPEKGEKGSE